MSTQTPNLEALETVNQLSDGQTPAAARQLIESLRPEDYLGGGVEKEIFTHGDEQVVAFFTKQNLPPGLIEPTMKSYYYAGKLAHLLLPDNMPDIHLAGSSPPLLIIDRIYPAQNLPSVPGQNDSISKIYTVKALREKINKMGLADALDYNSDNFIITGSGEPVYVDTVNPGNLINNKELDSYIDSLNAEQKARARRLQSRLVMNIVD